MYEDDDDGDEEDQPGMSDEELHAWLTRHGDAKTHPGYVPEADYGTWHDADVCQCEYSIDEVIDREHWR